MSGTRNIGRDAAAGGLVVAACAACCAPLIAPSVAALFAGGSAGIAIAGQVGMAAAIAFAGGAYVWWRWRSRSWKAATALRSGWVMATGCCRRSDIFHAQIRFSEDIMIKLSRRTLLAAVAALAVAGPASARDPDPFDQAGFKAAQAAGEPIVIHVTAPWCGECRAQKPIVAELADQPEFAAMKLFNVDFDSQKDVLRAFRVQYQATFIVFKGETEVGRSTGVTEPAAIRALFEKAI